MDLILDIKLTEILFYPQLLSVLN